MVKCCDLTQGMRFLRLSSGWLAPFGGHELNRPGKNGSKMSSVPAGGVNPGSPVPNFEAPGTHQLPPEPLSSLVKYGCPGHLPLSQVLTRIRRDKEIGGISGNSCNPRCFPVLEHDNFWVQGGRI